MTAILIDTKAKEIREVEYSGNYTHIYDLIDCTTFDCVGIGDTDDVIYVDDEGLFKGGDTFFCFYEEHIGMHRIIKGDGLILGTDEDGGSISPAITLEEATKLIRFLNDAEAYQLAVMEGQ